MITKSELNLYLEQIDIKEYLENEYSLDFTYSNKGWYMTNCPMPNHTDSSPSFGVNPEACCFNCFSCGANGNFLDLIMKLDGLSFNEALERVKEISGGGGTDVLSQINRSVKAALNYIDEYFSGIRESKLPAGLTEAQFMMTVSKRLKTYQANHPEIENLDDKIEAKYKSLDELLDKEDYNGIRKFWKTLTQGLKDD